MIPQEPTQTQIQTKTPEPNNQANQAPVQNVSPNQTNDLNEIPKL